MAYIAVKNTEHKGVYEAKNFNKELYKTKGMSYRTFKTEELNEALEWAGVKDVKSTKNNKINKQESKKVKNKADNIENEAYKIIMDYKNKGCEGICLTTKNLGEIILKLNNFAIVKAEMSNDFDSDTDNLCEHYKQALKQAKVKVEEYNNRDSFYRTRTQTMEDYYPMNKEIKIIKFNSLSDIKELSSKYIKLDNFWAEKRIGNPFDSRDVTASRIFKIRYREDDLWDIKNNVIINCDDIVSMMPLEFIYPQNGFNTYRAYGDRYEYIKIKWSEIKKIEKIFRDAGDGELTNLEILDYEY